MRPAHIPAKQWKLAAGFHVDGRLASLRDVMNPAVATVDGPALSSEQRVTLTVHRLQSQAKFRLGVLGVGIVDKDRAITEVRDGTSLGLALVAVEHRAIDLMRQYRGKRTPSASRKRLTHKKHRGGTASRERRKRPKV